MTDTRTPAPASDDAMGVWHSARRAFSAAGYSNGVIQLDHDTLNQAAARIIQQYGDQREAAGFRRGVEAAAKVAKEWFPDGSETRFPKSGVVGSILALLETQEARHD